MLPYWLIDRHSDVDNVFFKGLNVFSYKLKLKADALYEDTYVIF